MTYVTHLFQQYIQVITVFLKAVSIVTITTPDTVIKTAAKLLNEHVIVHKSSITALLADLIMIASWKQICLYPKLDCNQHIK